MEGRSRADQELFLPHGAHSQAQGQEQQQARPGQTRYYEGLSSDQALVENTASPGQNVPAINLIGATPSTSRTSTVRSHMSPQSPHEDHPQTMSGGLSNVVEEEDLYGAPTSSAGVPTAAPPIPQKSPARPDYNTSDVASHTAPLAQPSEPAYVPTQEAAHAPPPHPPSYDDWRAEHLEEERPPLPGPRPPLPTVGASQATSEVHPSVHLDTDQDYAYALQLQEEEEHQAPPLPQRPRPTAPGLDRDIGLSSHELSAEEQDRALAMRLQEEEDNTAPGLPVRPGQQRSSALAPNEPPAFTTTPSTEHFLPPPRRTATDFGADNPSDPIHYIRDPHKLIAYLVPFPTPQLKNAPSESIPKRFFIYTPPPPPLQAPPEGVKEDRTHKIQRKWQNEVRQAKLSEAKTTSWPGFKAKFTRGVAKAMTYTTTSNVDFLSRIQPGAPTTPSRSPSPPIDGKDNAFTDSHAEDPAHQSHETKRTVGIDEMIFVYSPSMNLTPDAMREEFVNTVMRTKSKAMRDSVIATGLLPISLAVDIVLIAVSGLFEVNAAWAYFNIKGAKTARSISKRLSSSTTSAQPQVIDPEKSDAEMQKEDKLKLDFKPATRIDILTRYLYAECHKIDPKYFPEFKTPPTESDCLEAIGWAPHQTGGQKNWEDEAWELTEVKDDLKLVMHKAAKEWRSYCINYEKNPEKNLNK